MADEWINAAEALRLASAALGSDARRVICARAHAGLITARAVRFLFRQSRQDDAEIPAVFWWAHGEEALSQNWAAGDFSTWIDGETELQAYGVTFSRAGIEALTGPAIATRAPGPEPNSNAGGRPAAAWWDDMWVEMCRLLYAGDLKPKKQSDIENAMNDWAAARGQSVAVSTIRPRARKLWTALRTEDKN
jgi:hypothetical protein